jgi:hypothetical protein
MSKNMPYYAIDKVAATINLDAKARVKWENRASASPNGEAVTTFIAKFLENVVRDDPFTIDDMKRAQAYMEKNAIAREKRKARKGIK